MLGQPCPTWQQVAETVPALAVRPSTLSNTNMPLDVDGTTNSDIPVLYSDEDYTGA